MRIVEQATEVLKHSVKMFSIMVVSGSKDSGLHLRLTADGGSNISAEM
jgi:hypothetical protein